jgi:hypothetical protein
MAGPGLPVNVDTSYADSGTDASVQLHQAHHDAVHNVVNDFDTANAASAGFVPVGNGTVLVTRALLSTDIPGMVANARTASYTLVLTDAGKFVTMSVASANTLTVPPNSSVAFPVGTLVDVLQYGAGVTTLTAGSGVTLSSRGNLHATAGQYALVSLTKLATDVWLLAGDLA